MSRKLHKFQTEAEYQAYSASTDYTTPCVAVVEENNVIYYDYGNNKPQVDLSDFKVEPQEISVGGDYYGGSAITKVHYIPSGITSLNYRFSDWSSLKEVTCEIPSGVTGMIQTFFKCQNLVKVPDIPSSVRDMTNAFANCSSLVNAPNIHSGVEEMYYTFYGCTSIVKAPAIPNSVTSLRSTLRACSSLVTAPEIPNSVTSMISTFQSCSSLVTAPEIPDSVTNIEATFYNCTKLKEATFLHTTPPSYFDTLDNCQSLETIYVPDSALEDYRTATGWSQFASKFKPLSSKPSE